MANGFSMASSALSTRWFILSVALAMRLVLPAQAQKLDESPPAPNTAQGEREGDERLHYGPPADEPRKTLLQWSYGTSFGGGPELDKPLVSDRPDFTQSTVTVGRGVLQIESGYTYNGMCAPGWACARRPTTTLSAWV